MFGGIVADGAMAINADTPFYMGGYGGTTYMRYESTGNNVEFYNQGNRRLKLSSTGGHLHGPQGSCATVDGVDLGAHCT